MKKNLKRLFGYSYTMGTTSLIASSMPTIAKPPIQTVATVGSPFVAPMSAVTGSSIILKQLRRLKLKKKRKRRLK